MGRFSAVDLTFERQLDTLRTAAAVRTTAQRASIIERDFALQILRCAACDEVHQYGRSTASNPEAMALLVERVIDDHQDCRQFLHDPARARRERGVKTRIRREMRKLACGKRMF